VDAAGIHGQATVTGPKDQYADTTVQDELALAIGICLNVGMSPNCIAGLLLRTGWQPPDHLPYLAEMEVTRDG
jgi:hypothetical protein